MECGCLSVRFFFLHSTMTQRYNNNTRDEKKQHHQQHVVLSSFCSMCLSVSTFPIMKEIFLGSYWTIILEFPLHSGNAYCCKLYIYSFCVFGMKLRGGLSYQNVSNIVSFPMGNTFSPYIWMGGRSFFLFLWDTDLTLECFTILD